MIENAGCRTHNSRSAPQTRQDHCTHPVRVYMSDNICTFRALLIRYSQGSISRRRGGGRPLPALSHPNPTNKVKNESSISPSPLSPSLRYLAIAAFGCVSRSLRSAPMLFPHNNCEMEGESACVLIASAPSVRVRLRAVNVCVIVGLSDREERRGKEGQGKDRRRKALLTAQHHVSRKQGSCKDEMMRCARSQAYHLPRWVLLTSGPSFLVGELGLRGTS